MKWRTYSIRTLCLLTLGAALFSAGYHLGSQHRRNDPFNKLIDLIEATIAPQSWDDVGGPGQIADWDTGCYVVNSSDPFGPQIERAMSPDIKYEINIYWSAADNRFIAEVPELPGCTADGETHQNALTNVEVIIAEWVETARELGRSIPTPRGRGG
jgi:predicted RNase H-like HicB family nuclease